MANCAKIVCWSFVLSAFLQGSQEVDLDGTCDDTNTCSTQDAECIATKCSCKSGFKKEGSACKKAINSNCGNVNECVTNTVCETTCKCKEGYTADADGLCKKAIGQTCTNANECVSNTDCADDSGTNKCQCSASFKPANGLCEKSSSATIKNTVLLPVTVVMLLLFVKNRL